MQRILSNIERIARPAPGEMAALRAILQPRTLPPDTLYAREGEVCRTIAFVEKGCGRLFYALDGLEVSKEFVFENGLLGSLVSFYTQRPSFVHVMTLTETQVLEVTYDEVMALCGQYPVWQRFAQLLVQDQLGRLESREASLLKDTPQERYTRLLNEHPKVFRRVPTQYVASYLGVTAEMLDRYQRATPILSL